MKQLNKLDIPSKNIGVKKVTVYNIHDIPLSISVQRIKNLTISTTDGMNVLLTPDMIYIKNNELFIRDNKENQWNTKSTNTNS